MDLITLYKENFTIFIGIFVALAIMGITTLYDRYKEKGGASPSLKESGLFSGSSKIASSVSEVLRQFSGFGKKISNLVRNKAGSNRKKSGSSQKKPTSAQKNSSKNFIGQLETMIFKAKDTCQTHFAGFLNRISSLSSSLPRRNKSDKEKFVPFSEGRNADLKFDSTDKINNLEKAVESKKEELDFEDDLLTKMSTSGSLAASSSEPANNANKELSLKEPSPGEMSSGLDFAFDNNFTIDESEFAIKVDGLEDEPVENEITFSENSTEIKFGDEKDNLLDSLKKDIVVKNEKKINFMDNMQGENLDIKLIKSDLEGVLKDMKKYKQYTSRN
ncbi:hypothetical protein RSJ42_10625 [Methanosarcina hadiensis]|uniref:hypothetical protein n=1 Tax=Methanosarcina hadiensis TaxID=3078083 RepID=UPI00397747AC